MRILAIFARDLRFKYAHLILKTNHLDIKAKAKINQHDCPKFKLNIIIRALFATAFHSVLCHKIQQ